jgi:nucleotide-binding universal stress UspA family protein
MPDVDVRPPFRKAVIGLNGGPTDERVLHFGCQLARAGGGSLVAVHVIEVDWTHELSEDMATNNDRAAAILEAAEDVARRYKVPLSVDLLQARDVAAALVDEAVELDADMIILGLPYRKRFGGDFALGQTIPYIFHNAPAQVVVVREPVGGSEDRAAVASGWAAQA